MAIRNNPLRASEEWLSSSRQQYIQSLEDKKVFEQECTVIIPELDRLWKEKILPILGYTPDTVADRFGMLLVNETHTINWKHYLYNYAPQVLSKAISRLASRLSMDGGVAKNTRGMVNNVAAYYKKLVQDLRRQEIRRQEKEGRLRLSGQATDHIWLMEDKPGKIGIRLDCGDSGVVFVSPKQAADLAEQLLSFLPKPECPICFEAKGIQNSCLPQLHPDAQEDIVKTVTGRSSTIPGLEKPECQKCYDEEGSLACIRFAHKLTPTA